MPTESYREALLRETREELAKADAKASILLAASGIVVTALLTVGTTAPWYPDTLKHHGARVFAWIAVGLTLLGILLVGAAVKPLFRAKRDQLGTPHYFADVAAYRPRWWQWRSRRTLVEKGREAFRNALAAMQADEYDERLDDQIWSVSHFAARKYRLVSAGMWLYAGAIVSALVAFALEKQWL
jgi:hypothetical protein